MDSEILELLETEIKEGFKEASKLEVGKDMHREAINTTVKLCELRMNIEKEENERLEKIECQSRDRKENIVKFSIMATEILVPLLAYNFWLNKGLRFEETGSITSSMNRNIISKIFPRKK